MITMEQRLERGEIVAWERAPFALPAGEDLTFLLRQRLTSSIHKNISYNPVNDTLTGVTSEDAERLQQLMRDFSQRARAWLGEVLPSYASAWTPDRATLRTEEEATRKLRLTARNDLLHFDAFPSRPARGHRILRLYVNINPTDDRVWATSDTFAKVLEKYGKQVGLPAPRPATWVRCLIGLFQPNAIERTEYDEFMLRLHHFLKANDEFQDRSARRLWHFKPGSSWLLFTDAVTHAELRGQYALEHSFFVAAESLVLPEEAPAVLLQQACGTLPLPAAA